MAPVNIDPHAGQPVLRAGPSPKDARLVAILLHGRGASAEDILGLADQFSATDIAYVAPQAAGSTWYPYSFLAPIATERAVARLGAPRDRRPARGSRSSRAFRRSGLC